jgi:hypothetical protein
VRQIVAAVLEAGIFSQLGEASYAVGAAGLFRQVLGALEAEKPNAA